ncbi:MAG TPA: ABC transporter ATP-binding protein [Frankiaceae bacterium]|jgi:putative ABC transport system ATP-binding protein|nr:ABC transporter ATP-binding protein [Frankiaceae bacterium]
MSTLSVNPDAGGTVVTFRRAFRMAPEFARGLGFTLFLAVLSTAGRVVIPVAVQQTIDHGLGGASSASGTKVDLGAIRASLALAAIAVLVTATAAYLLNVRLFTSAESGLASLRVQTFRHVHDLSMLRQASQSRGALVSRVTSDVDQLSNFLQWGGIQLLVSVLQLALATVLMLVYSWPLTLLVYACFTPLALLARAMSVRLAAAYGLVRERVGLVLSAVSEAVVGAAVVKAFGVGERTGRRINVAIGSHRDAAVRAQRLAALTFSGGELVAGLANTGVVVVGVWLGVGGHLSAGRLVAFLFLVTLFVGPVQVATETLNDAQNALAGLRRVLDVLDTPIDVRDPATDPENLPNGGRELPPGPIDIRFRDVAYAYPGGPEVLRDVNLTIHARARVAVVGETGSGKTTLAKLLTRLIDPIRGSVELTGIPLQKVPFSSLRRRVVMVPQEGHLFESTIAENVRYGRPDASDSDVARAFDELGLTDWISGLPGGLQAPVGQRGESLSAGERQLVAVARAHLADPDLLVLDEATSAIDPATEMRLSAALESLAAGRTTVTIAHRLKAAELADEVIVVDAGRIVQRGRHADLVDVPGVYARLHASWSARGTLL